MSFSLNKHGPQYGDTLHYHPKMRRHFEQYMGWLRGLDTNELRSVDPHLAYKYEGDFYGLLKEMGIAPELHWLIMRVNDLTNPLDFPDNIQHIVIPDLTAVSRIMQRYRSQLKKKEL